MEGYAMSRLLAKLELHRYVACGREGVDKVVSVLKTQQLILEKGTLTRGYGCSCSAWI